MANCERPLWDLIKKIEPTKTQKNGAARSQNQLRNALDSGNMGARIETSYLSGSYARDTAIHPLDDVDIIFVIDPSYWRKSFSLLFGWSDYPAPRSVLDSFARAIRYRYQLSSVYGQRRSVRLELFHLDIDVVPAISDSSKPALLRIPDSRANKWILTSPLLHSDIATATNKFQEGRFKPLVKLLKYWNGNLPSTAKFKSFAIETLAVRVFRSLKFDSLQEGLIYFFDFVVLVSGKQTFFTWKDTYGVSLRWLSANIPDSAGMSGNVIEGVDDERRSRFVTAAIKSRNKMDDSFKARSVETGCCRIAEALKM